MILAANTPFGVVPARRTASKSNAGLGHARVELGEQREHRRIVDAGEVLARLVGQARCP